MKNVKVVYLLLFSRLFLFLFFQSLIALLMCSWEASEKYWMLVATMGNIVSIFLLIWLYKIEGLNYFNLFHFNRENWKRDFLYFIGLSVVLIPVVLIPGYFLSKWFWTDVTVPTQILFQLKSLPLIYIILVTFPITIALAELPTYFGYSMPHLEKQVKQKWLLILIPVLFLSIQHCFLPLVFNGKFILYRALMYFPFALLLGIVLQKRSRLLPYFVVLHGLMDMQAVLMLL